MHIIADISSHGLGHLSQSCRVLEALHERTDGLQVTFRTMLPDHRIREQYSHPFEKIERVIDVGMVMADAVTVLPEESIEAYRQFHLDWERRVKEESLLLQSLNGDLLFSNIGYLGLAAAAQAGIPSYAFCSLNWAEILEGYCGAKGSVGVILEQIRDSYNRANLFIRPTPYMSMKALAHCRDVGPVGRRGVDRSGELRKQIGVEAGVRIGLVSMGGIATELPVYGWPLQRDIHWIVQGVDRAAEGVTPMGSTGLSFIDLLASVYLMLIKPGYGMIVEAAIAGTPILYLPRGDWPEESALLNWFSLHGRAAAITVEEYRSGHLSVAISRLLSMAESPRPVATGADEAAEMILHSATGAG